MKANRLIVQKLFSQNLLSSEIWKAAKPLGLKRRFVYYNIAKLQETGSVENRYQSGRPRTARTKRMVRIVKARISRNPQRSTRKLGRDLQISKSSIHRILRDDCQFKAYHKRKVHGLTSKQKDARRLRCKALLARFDDKSVENIIFSDEKLFVVQQSHNSKNDIVYALSIDDIPENIRTVQRFQNTSSVMVWAALSKKGKFPLVFIEKGVKINANYYQSEILERQLLANVGAIHPDGNWVFQQDSAPAHMAKATQAWCRANCPAFISTQEWPSSSPDLNPLDFSIWGLLEARVNVKQHHSIESLKRKLIKEWNDLSMNYVRDSINSWRERLRLVSFARGGRFEQFLK